jgi:hypothetical protein
MWGHCKIYHASERGKISTLRIKNPVKKYEAVLEFSRQVWGV